MQRKPPITLFQRLTWVVLASLLLATVAGARAAQTQTQTQTPPPVRPGIKETVIVMANEDAIIADGIQTLRASRDPVVSTTVADNILVLADAMAASGRLHMIGPLTKAERTVVDLDNAVARHVVEGGPIRLQVRRTDSLEGSEVSTLTRSSFISFCADIASEPPVQLRVVQETKMIVVARIIRDLDEQQQGLISEREILKGVLLGFADQDRRGVIINRVLDIADAMATTPATYDLVPADERDAFSRLAEMGSGAVFALMSRPAEGMVNVSYGGAIHSTSADHFVWFFIRFVLADPSHADFDTRPRRIYLGGKLLDYLTLQLQINTVDAIAKGLSTARPAGPDGISIGTFRARGPGLTPVTRAPGLSRQQSALGPDYCVLVVSPKDVRKVPELETWLRARAKDLNGQILKSTR